VKDLVRKSNKGTSTMIAIIGMIAPCNWISNWILSEFRTNWNIPRIPRNQFMANGKANSSYK